MARTTFVWRDGAVIERSQTAPSPWAPSIRPDGMDAIECPADGRVYDSKSAYYAAVDRAGCAILGSQERPPARRAEPPPVRDTMKRVLEQLRSR